MGPVKLDTHLSILIVQVVVTPDLLLVGKVFWAHEEWSVKGHVTCLHWNVSRHKSSWWKHLHASWNLLWHLLIWIKQQLLFWDWFTGWRC